MHLCLWNTKKFCKSPNGHTHQVLNHSKRSEKWGRYWAGTREGLQQPWVHHPLGANYYPELRPPLHYTRSQARNNLGPSLSIFGLLFGPKLLIKCYNIDVRILINKCWNIYPKGCKNWLSKSNGIPFFSLRANTRP